MFNTRSTNTRHRRHVIFAVLLVFGVINGTHSVPNEQTKTIKVQTRATASPGPHIGHGDSTAETNILDALNLNTTELEKQVLTLVDLALRKLDSLELMDGVSINKTTPTKALPKQRSLTTGNGPLFGDMLVGRLQKFAQTHIVNMNVPRAAQTGRLFFFKGLKKLMWPLMIGMQIVKTVLFAMFLPSIIGSLGRIVGKGLTSVSGFANPSETVSDLDFKDNSLNMEQEKYGDYSYPPQQDSTGAANNFASQMYDSAAMNNAASRFGLDGQKVTYINTPTGDFFSRNTNQMTKKDDFKVFHDIPSSSMLLTNYDPFYSPLLSRLDAVFQQLGLGKGEEKCREKLVCLMYANPAKYAPYSNLVSAQLSRELNELRKPSTDNPEILRFFKYMRAAKDGQDGTLCESSFKECTTLKESDNPAMLVTYNDINKLVAARKLA